MIASAPHLSEYDSLTSSAEKTRSSRLHSSIEPLDYSSSLACQEAPVVLPGSTAVPITSAAGTSPPEATGPLTIPVASRAAQLYLRPTACSGNLSHTALLLDRVRSLSNAHPSSYMRTLVRGLSPLPTHATKMIKFVLAQCERKYYYFILMVLIVLSLRRWQAAQSLVL